MRTKLQISAIALVIFVMLTCNAFGQEIKFKKLVPPEEKTFDYTTGFAQDEKGVM